MAEYIDKSKIPWVKTDNPKGKYWDRIVCESTIKNMESADVVERSEYEYLKKENRELAIKYDNAMNMVINEQENVTRLRSKIDEAIEEIEKRSFDNEPFIVGECLKTYRDEVLEILKRNIGE